LRNSGILFV